MFPGWTGATSVSFPSVPIPPIALTWKNRSSRVNYISSSSNWDSIRVSDSCVWCLYCFIILFLPGSLNYISSCAFGSPVSTTSFAFSFVTASSGSMSSVGSSSFVFSTPSSWSFSADSSWASGLAAESFRCFRHRCQYCHSQMMPQPPRHRLPLQQTLIFIPRSGGILVRAHCLFLTSLLGNFFGTFSIGIWVHQALPVPPPPPLPHHRKPPLHTPS